MKHQAHRHHSLLASGLLLATVCIQHNHVSVYGRSLQHERGGGWKDDGWKDNSSASSVHSHQMSSSTTTGGGPPSEIDCSLSSSNYSYYIERCHDEFHQLWINGQCTNGAKEEYSTLNHCRKMDGTKPYCHDCKDGSILNHVCGSDSNDYDKVCKIASEGTAKDCGDEGLTTYSHRCSAPSGGSTSWYLREAFHCDQGAVFTSGPGPNYTPGGPEEFTCGNSWYYPFSLDDHVSGKEQPFATKENTFCLDCGLGISVCAQDLFASCTSLGLPEKGSDLSLATSDPLTSTTLSPTPDPLSSVTLSPTPDLLSISTMSPSVVKMPPFQTQQPTGGATADALKPLPSSHTDGKPSPHNANPQSEIGPPSLVDCSLSSSDFEYYIEQCWNETSQWWVNGHCINGVKEEDSELHNCRRPDGKLPYCHDCSDGKGNIKSVCGSDSPNYDEVCGVALAGSGKDCGDLELTAYSHQCKVPSGGTKSWYLRETIDCKKENAVYKSGPYLYEVPSEYICGESWYWPFRAHEHVSGEKHPFSSKQNQYCLDCGIIQVCAYDEKSTCSSLGLPEKASSVSTSTVPAGDGSSELTTPAPSSDPLGSGTLSPVSAAVDSITLNPTSDSLSTPGLSSRPSPVTLAPSSVSVAVETVGPSSDSMSSATLNPSLDSVNLTKTQVPTVPTTKPAGSVSPSTPDVPSDAAIDAARAFVASSGSNIITSKFSLWICVSLAFLFWGMSCHNEKNS